MTRTALTAAAAITGATLATAAVVAQPTAAIADDTTDHGRMVLLLDSSGSMSEPAQGGMTKIDAAKKSLTGVISNLPVDAQVGLRVFGATVQNASDKGACSDSQLAVPLGTNNKAALQAAVSTYKPYGETPIAYALQQAAKDLGTTGKRSIVLVSDGEATCKPDPCDVAKQIASSGVDMSVNVVGLAVDDKTRKQLQCIASSGKGQYYDVKNSDQLSQALEKAQAQSIRPAGTVGKPVKGTPTAVGAPSIQVGDYTDSIGAKDTDAGVKYYQLHRTIPGSTIVATAALDPAMGHTDNFTVDLVAGNDTCQSADAPAASDGSSQLLTATVGSVQDSNDTACVGSTDLMLRVTRTGEGADTLERPTQIRVTEVPPVMNMQDLPEAPTLHTLDKPNLSAGIKVVPGSSLANATTIASGTTYENAATPGQLHVYKVPVGYGQTLAVHFQVPKPSPSLAKTYENTKMWADAKVLDPSGQQMDRTNSTLMDWDSSELLQVENVTFKNSKSYLSSNPWLAGYYTVVISTRGPANGPAVSVPYRFVATVDGAVTGVPVFAKAGQVPTPSPTPSEGAGLEETAEATPTGTDTASATDSPAAEATSTDSAEPTAATSNQKSRTLPMVLGLAGLVLVAAGAAVAVTRRRR